MEDYDPTAFRRTSGDVLAAWALCTMLFAAIFIGSLINDSSSLDEQNVPMAANNIYGSVRTNDPAQKIISSCELLRKKVAQEGQAGANTVSQRKIIETSPR